jgi:hypothetical protein
MIKLFTLGEEALKAAFLFVPEAEMFHAASNQRNSEVKIAYQPLPNFYQVLRVQNRLS